MSLLTIITKILILSNLIYILIILQSCVRVNEKLAIYLNKLLRKKLLINNLNATHLFKY